MNKNILLIEDDLEISNLIHKYLEKEEMLVTQVFDGREALQKIQRKEYNLIILDIMLPNMDGLELLRRIREDSTVPVLLLTAKREDTDKVIGLGMGADDYITKPFSVFELVARVKAHLRRYLYFQNTSKPKERQKLVHQELELDLESRSVYKNGKRIPITAREYQILKLFLQYPKKVFAKEEIFYHVWGEDFQKDENTVMVHISRLRSKIEDNPSKPTYIQTVWGFGYKLGEKSK